jgi:hypothetical protein
MFAATREFIDDTYVYKSVQKSKNDKLPSSQKSRLRLTINEDNQKVAVKTTRMRSYHLIITEVKLKLIINDGNKNLQSRSFLYTTTCKDSPALLACIAVLALGFAPQRVNAPQAAV